MQASTSTQVLAVLAFVALQKLFLELPRLAQLSVLATEVIVLVLASILLWRGDSCGEPEHSVETPALVQQPLVVVPLKGERDDAESDVETESTAGTDAVGTDTESIAGSDSDWSSSDEDADMLLSCCLPGSAWCDVGARLCTVFHQLASEPMASEDEEPSMIARCSARRSASADLDEAEAFELASDDDDEDLSLGRTTGRRLANALVPAREADADPWLSIGRRVSVALSEISASALADEEDFPQSPLGWSIVSGRVATVLRKIASSEPMESDDEDGFPIVVQNLLGLTD